MIKNSQLPEVWLVKRFIHNFSNLPEYIGKGIGTNAGYWNWHKELLHEKFNSVLLENIFSRVIPFCMGFIVISGVLLCLLRKERIISLYIITTISTMLFTPWPSQFARYLMPVIPFLMLVSIKLLLWSIENRENRIKPHFISQAMAMLIGFVIFIVFTQELKTFRDSNKSLKNTRVLYSEFPREEGFQYLFYYDNTWSSFDSALSWLKNNASDRDLIITSAPHRVFIKTGLKAVMPPFESDNRKAQFLIDSVPGNYLLVDTFEYITIMIRYCTILPEAFPLFWERVYESADAKASIYKRR